MDVEQNRYSDRSFLIMAAAVGLVAISSPVNAQDTVKVGTLQSLTGEAQNYGTVFTQSLQMAIDEINASGGILGKQIQLVVEDSKCTGPDAVAAYSKLTKVDGVKIIFGSTCSGEFLAVAGQMDADKVLGLANVSHPDVATGHPFVYRNGPTSERDGLELATFMIKHGVKSVATVTQETDYAEGFRKAITKHLEGGGVTIAQQERTRAGDTDFRPLLTRLLGSKPEAIIFSMQSEESCGSFLRQVRELGYQGELYSSPTCVGNVTSNIAKDHMTGMYSVIAPVIEKGNEKGRSFLERYRAKYGETTEDFYMAAAYDQPYLVKLCAEKQQTLTDTTKLKECLDNIKEFDGAIGKFGFDEEGEITGVIPKVVRIRPLSERTEVNGLFEVVK
jgi:branched-chain amino acid transport system substrate-binding protein